MYLRGVLVFLAGIVWLTYICADYDLNLFIAFFHWPTIFMVVCAMLAVIMFSGGFKLFAKAVNALISKKYYISAADQAKSIRLFKLMSQSMIGMSVLMTFICFVLILLNLGDLSALGHKIGAALVAIVYGALAKLVFIDPAIHLLETRFNEGVKAAISDKQVMDKLLELCYRQGVTPEEIMEANEIRFNNP
jgi:flagellar motor component MotA